MIKVDLTNQKFGKLTVLEYSHTKNKKNIGSVNVIAVKKRQYIYAILTIS